MQGGIDAVHQNNQRKAQTVYDAIAASNGFYQNPVDPAAQSLMNVPFTIPSNADLEKEFISKAAAAGLVRPLMISTAPSLLRPLQCTVNATVCEGASDCDPSYDSRGARVALCRCSSRATDQLAACGLPSTTRCRRRVFRF